MWPVYPKRCLSLQMSGVSYIQFLSLHLFTNTYLFMQGAPFRYLWYKISLLSIPIACIWCNSQYPTYSILLHYQWCSVPFAYFGHHCTWESISNSSSCIQILWFNIVAYNMSKQQLPLSQHLALLYRSNQPSPCRSPITQEHIWCNPSPNLFKMTHSHPTALLRHCSRLRRIHHWTRKDPILVELNVYKQWTTKIDICIQYIKYIRNRNK